MSDRGMKKWAPYSSLIEQATCLEEMRYRRNKIDKPILEDDQIERINFVLTTYLGQLVKIKFFYDGYIYFIERRIKKIDVDNQRLIFEEGKLKFEQLLDINSIDEY